MNSTDDGSFEDDQNRGSESDENGNEKHSIEQPNNLSMYIGPTKLLMNVGLM